ncbi:MAG: hypothetical protein CMH46_00310 [Muricauda sp.]|nr:hypothetical protein [Allomuricauda sp.]MAU13965.1 hypothetical protein [Allomuricauda sp.]
MNYNDEEFQELNFQNDRNIQINENIFEEPFTACECVLCTKSNLGENGKSIVDELRKIDNELIGKVTDNAIYSIMARYYQDTIRGPSQRHSPELEMPYLMAQDFKNHFMFHDMNPKRMLKEDITFLNDAQEFLKKNGIVTENTTNGAKKINMGYMKQWNILSKTKLDLIRYYTTHYSESDESKQSATKPQEFSNF